MGRPRSTSRPDGMGIAMVVVGALIAASGLLLLLMLEDPGAPDVRAIARSLVVGAAAAAYGLYRLGSGRARGDKGAGETGTAEKPAEAARPADTGAPSLEGMLSHSENVAATLRDVVDHGGDGFGDLPELLRRAGLMDWPDPPVMTAHRLRRSGRWWLTAEGEVSAPTFDRLLAIEFALNLSEDLAARPPAPDSASSLEARVRAALAGTHDLQPREPGDAEPPAQLLAFMLEDADERGEWSGRMRFADAFENLPVPLRVSADFRLNAAQGLMCVDLGVPRPACCATVAADPRVRDELAAAYALRIGLAVGRIALASSPELSRVVVNCRHEGGETLLSLDLSAASLARLCSLADGPLDALPLPDDPALRARPDEAGTLGPVTPFLTFADERLCPPERFREVELDNAPAGAGLERACGARRVSDLGIMEKAGRVRTWNTLVAHLGDTTQEAVSHLVELRDRTTDVTVAEACERTSKALVAGTTDVTDVDALAHLFVDGGQLAVATERVRAALEGDPSPAQLEGLLAELEAVLSPLTEMGIYLDDTASVYRYFNSLPERITHNLASRDDGRTVRLVPDEYYAAHSLAARLLNMLGRSAAALPHADELMRIAPVTPDAALAKVRVLEEQSRIFEASDLLKEAIGYASTSRDLAICFYRLAYMEWKLGRSDLAVACYQRAIALHPAVAEMARGELDDLLDTSSNLKMLPDDAVIDALEQGGLPTGDLPELRRRTRDALVATTDAGLFGVAGALMSAFLELVRDDALLDVRRSLMRP